MVINSTEVIVADQIMVWGKFLTVTSVTSDAIFCGMVSLARGVEFNATVKR